MSKLAASAIPIPLPSTKRFPASNIHAVPGHEIAGTIDAVGDDVVGWEKGDRVGVGWHGGHDGNCDGAGAGRPRGRRYAARRRCVA
ncbi:MAG: alcohol dehydrogenase catalytic domain-containing protein [Vulcanimicrobiaceae bacterium]